MKENKSVQIKVRITPTDNEKLQAYCEVNELTVSQCVRNALKELLNGGKQNG